MALIKQGFYQIGQWMEWLYNWTDGAQGAMVSIGAKTGTAETFVNGGTSAINTNVLSYAQAIILK